MKPLSTDVWDEPGGGRSRAWGVQGRRRQLRVTHTSYPQKTSMLIVDVVCFARASYRPLVGLRRVGGTAPSWHKEMRKVEWRGRQVFTGPLRHLPKPVPLGA